MKKIVLIALVALVAVACVKKVKPVEDVVVATPTLIDSIVLVEGAGEVVTDFFAKDIEATEEMHAQKILIKLHHQATLNSGVYELLATDVDPVEGEKTVTDTGRFTIVEGGEFPIYEMTTFATGTTFFYALKGDIIELLDANKMPLNTPYELMRVAVAPTSDVVAEEIETVVAE